MRKFKQVKRKEIIFDLAEWNEVKRRAEQISMTTSEYIRRMAVNGKISRFKISDITPVINALRIIGGNINQVAKKSNEINSIYAEDIKILQNNLIAFPFLFLIGLNHLYLLFLIKEQAFWFLHILYFVEIGKRINKIFTNCGYRVAVNQRFNVNHF